MKVLITGATGNAGREVARALNRLELPHRLGSRSPRNANGVRFDFEDRGSWDAALADCQGVFLVRPPPISDVDRTLGPFIDTARARGVQLIVFMSVAGAEDNRWVPHHKVEQWLLRGEGDYVILRPGFFAQNFQDAYARDIREDEQVYVPAGRGRAAFIDLYDLAELTASIFQTPQAHCGRGYTLTGGEAVDFYEATRRLSQVLGRTIRYEPASVLGYWRHLRRRGMPRMQVVVQTVLHVGLRWGQGETVDPTLERLLGRPPRPLDTYFEENREQWFVGGRLPVALETPQR